MLWTLLYLLLAPLKCSRSKAADLHVLLCPDALYRLLHSVLHYETKAQGEALCQGKRRAQLQLPQALHAAYPSWLRHCCRLAQHLGFFLQVDYTGFSTINAQRFGQKFVGKVANPHDILLWHKAPVRKAKVGLPLACHRSVTCLLSPACLPACLASKQIQVLNIG